MFSFVPLINNYVTIGLIVLLLSRSTIILSIQSTFCATHQYFHFLLVIFINIFINIIHIIQLFNISLESLKPTFSRLLINNWYFASYGSLGYKWILSIFGWWFIILSNAFVFPDPGAPVINNLFGWSGICGQFGLRFFIFFLVSSSKLISFVLFYYIGTFNFFICTS